MADRGDGAGVSATYVEEFSAISPRENARESWVQQLRRSAMDRFAQVGFPAARDEDWRFTNISPISGGTFQLAPADVSGVAAARLNPYLFAIPGASRLVFINGRYAPGLSHLESFPAGARVRNLASAYSADGAITQRHLGQYARPERNGFVALNTAFMPDGAFIHVPAGVDLGAPVHLLFLTDARSAARAIYPRNLIVLERGARAAVLESYVGLDDVASLTNAVTEIVVSEGATIEHLKIQRESEHAYHIGTAHIHQERDSRSTSHSVSLGGAIARNDLDVTLAGSGIESTLLGLYLGRGRQLVDNHTAIRHAYPSCSTREVYKGILDDASHAVFNGKVFVTPEAQKTDAKQTNRNLLLSDRARIDTKPQLEIFADDVKCTHGATVGRLDPMSFFYLQSRGIGLPLARRILTYAFAAEVLEEIPFESVRLGLEQTVLRRLDEQVSF
ncbi:MAG: Fe-S cluster assembly protein SufD [Gemmatimonadota bacterium]